MTTRKPCINVPSATYSGKELSPLHFGQSAEGYDINTIMEGFDKVMWIVKMKNNRKVWLRHTVTNKLLHEEPIIHNDTEEVVIKEPIPEKVEIMKPIVEEKKMTDYNAFLTYRLYQLKQQNVNKTSNKELFNSVVAEWKQLKKNTSELQKIIAIAHEFNNNAKKTD